MERWWLGLECALGRNTIFPVREGYTRANTRGLKWYSALPTGAPWSWGRTGLLPGLAVASPDLGPPEYAMLLSWGF